MTVKLVTEHHLEFLSLKGGCTGSYESTFVKMPHCWKSHATANIVLLFLVWNKWIYYTSSISVSQSVLLHGSIYLSGFMDCLKNS